jgi:hypothetical protein
VGRFTVARPPLRRAVAPKKPPDHLSGDYDDADGAGCSHW